MAELLAKAEAADQADVPDGMSIPEELARREVRLAKIAEARAKIEARAKERFEREQAEHQAKLAERAAKAAATGKKPSGRLPQPPVEGPLPTDQINLTDEESRIMPVAGGGFEQCYNAQAVVAADSLLVVAADVVQAANDKQQLDPMLEHLNALPEELGKIETLLADNGYFSAANVHDLRRGEHRAADRDRARAASSVTDRAVRQRADCTAGPHPGSRPWRHRLKTPEGKKLYALRKQSAGTGVRHHQVGAGLPAVPAARARSCPGRVEPGDHGLEHEADVHPLPLRMRGKGAAASKFMDAAGHSLRIYTF